jgi:hypothetical protein
MSTPTAAAFLRLPRSCANEEPNSESANRPSSSTTATQPPRQASTPATTVTPRSSQLPRLNSPRKCQVLRTRRPTGLDDATLSPPPAPVKQTGEPGT